MTPCSSSSSSYAVTPKPTMISPSERKTPIKIAGYLEKKSKMRVVCRWKKQWFVLEGRLLLYYKSQLEYLSLSPCRGTVNMGLAASVIPGKSNEIIVSTRSHSVSLRALNRSDHDIWLQALMDAMCLPNSNHTLCCTKPVHHFRYSTGGLDHLENKAEIGYNLANHANTLSGKLSPLYVKTSPNISVPSTPIKSKSLIGRENIPERNSIDIYRKNSLARGLVHDGKDYKVEKLAKKFSKVAVSDTSIPGKFKVTSNDSMKANLLRRSLSVEEEVNRYSENIYESLKDVNKFESNIISKQTRKFVNRVNRSDSDCLMMITREKMNKSHTHFRSEQRIKTTGSPPLPVYERFGETFYHKKTDNPNNGDAMEKLWKLKMKYNNSRHNYEKEAKSDTDLSVRKHRSTMEESRNYGALYKNTGLSKRNSESYDFSNLQEIIKEKAKGPIPLPGAIRSTKTSRSNSILRTLTRMKSSDKSSGDLVKRNSMKKRSLSFLKKMWKRKDTKWEVDSFSSEINNFHEMQGPSSDFDNVSDFSTNDLSTGYDLPQTEPPPDYDQVNGSEDDEICQSPPELPPRFHHTRSASPCHDVPSNNKPVDPEPPPALPIKVRKLRKKNSHALDFLFHDNSDPGLRYLFQEEEYIQENGKENKDKELGEILTKLNEMNNAPLASFHLYENGQNSYGAKRQKDEEDPDYDIPRPHVSLLSSLRKQSCASDSLPATHFFSQYEDSLDLIASRDRFEEFTMAPDSLECDPWSLSNEGEVQSESWSLSCDMHDHRKSISDNLNHDSIYQDSLNPPLSHRLNEYMHLQTGYIQLHS